MPLNRTANGAAIRPGNSTVSDDAIHSATTLHIANAMVALATARFFGGPAGRASQFAHLSLFCAVGVGKADVEDAVSAALASVVADAEFAQLITVAGFANCGALGDTGPAGIGRGGRQFEVHSFAARGKLKR